MSTINIDPEYLFYTGATFTVEWYRDAAGRMPAKVYYEALSEDEQKRLDDLAARLADSPIGTRLPKPLYNEENSEHKIYALKPGDHRFFNFMTMGRKIILVNAYRKHSQKMSKKDRRVLQIAIRARNDYLIRVQRGNYYDRIP
jgi:mRNA-degrading endonuclease RelE of RelBE toxin-antitoxin system